MADYKPQAEKAIAAAHKVGRDFPVEPYGPEVAARIKAALDAEQIELASSKRKESADGR